MGMFLTIIESGGGGNLNITTETILFYVVSTEIEFEILNQVITWEMV
jgi:hypothetical protein